MPRGLKIFLLSILAGIFGTFFGFRVGGWIAEGFMMRQLVDIIGAVGFAIVVGLSFGAASAVTTGVMLGKKLKA